MSSNPELRMRITEKVSALGTVKADSLAELKQILELGDVSNTQFGKALRSLHYKYGPVRVNRPLVYDGRKPREYHVTYTGARSPLSVAAAL